VFYRIVTPKQCPRGEGKKLFGRGNGPDDIGRVFVLLGNIIVCRYPL